MNDLDLNNLLETIKKMDKKELEANLAKAQEILGKNFQKNNQ